MTLHLTWVCALPVKVLKEYLFSFSEMPFLTKYILHVSIVWLVVSILGSSQLAYLHRMLKMHGVILTGSVCWVKIHSLLSLVKRKRPCKGSCRSDLMFQVRFYNEVSSRISWKSATMRRHLEENTACCLGDFSGNMHCFHP